jgi:hypothetical protein
MHSYIKVLDDQGKTIIQDDGEGNIFDMIKDLQQEIAQKDEVIEVLVAKLGSIELASRGFAQKAEINNQIRQQQQMQAMQQAQQQAQAPVPLQQEVSMEQPIQPQPMPQEPHGDNIQQEPAQPIQGGWGPPPQQPQFRRPPQGDGTVL